MPFNIIEFCVYSVLEKIKRLDMKYCHWARYGELILWSLVVTK